MIYALFLPALAFFLPCLGALLLVRRLSWSPRWFFGGSSLWFVFFAIHLVGAFGLALLGGWLFSSGRGLDLFCFFSAWALYLILILCGIYGFFSRAPQKKHHLPCLLLGFGWAKLAALGFFHLSLAWRISTGSLPQRLMDSFLSPQPSFFTFGYLLTRSIFWLGSWVLLSWIFLRSRENFRWKVASFLLLAVMITLEMI